MAKVATHKPAGVTVECDGTTEWKVPDLSDEDGLFKSGKAVESG